MEKIEAWPLPSCARKAEGSAPFSAVRLAEGKHGKDDWRAGDLTCYGVTR
jgi:hypothetical protein